MSVRQTWHRLQLRRAALRQALIFAELSNEAETFRHIPDVDLNALDDRALINRFKALAIHETEAPGMDAVDHIYWQIDAVVEELAKRPIEAFRLLTDLYRHDDVRVRYRAADCARCDDWETATDRLNNITDDDWLPPSERPPGWMSALERSPTTELCARYRAIALEQQHASDYFKIPLFNRLYAEMAGIVCCLEGRREINLLLPLLSDRNVHVRLKTAVHLRGHYPDQARPVLEAIRDRQITPESGEAASALKPFVPRKPLCSPRRVGGTP
jgi:hypothetical protein